MRPGQGSKRSRGRGGRKPQNNFNRTFDSNGPDVKIRGSAPHINEKYLTLARDANASGDRIAAENYLQHAEHYFRIMMLSQPQGQQNGQNMRPSYQAMQVSDEDADDSRNDRFSSDFGRDYDAEPLPGQPGFGQNAQDDLQPGEQQNHNQGHMAVNNAPYNNQNSAPNNNPNNNPNANTNNGPHNGNAHEDGHGRRGRRRGGRNFGRHHDQGMQGMNEQGHGGGQPHISKPNEPGRDDDNFGNNIA